MAAQTAPAFPGAEGHARYITGGRGGKVIHVTNLNNSGTGSFRNAVSGSTKKIIVFDVAGVIPLSSDLTIGDNTTILGQTAPYPGITLRYYTVQPGNNNIIRYIRFRRGQEKDIDDGADASWQRQKSNIMFDHCSFSWSIDEVASFYDNNNFTMQWCTVAESLTNPGHSKGAHGYGGIWGGKLASFHHNMIAHVVNRGPRFNGARYGYTGYTKNSMYSTYKWANAVQAENVDFRNCVMYDAQGTCYGGPGGGQINIVNNYFKAGPSQGLSTKTINGVKYGISTGNERGSQERITLVTVATSGNADKNHPELYDMTSRYFISG
ncbi:MAG: pectate lyase, partial [Prevotella sp.]|nr:pectate lyase [Prevotella sp.]